MQEIEIKVLDINRKKIEKKLFYMDAVKFFEGKLIACYFDNAHKDVRGQGASFRLRKENSKSFLVHKKKN